MKAAVKQLGVVKMDDLVGLRVKLVCDVELRGGARLVKGTEYVVFSHWRGRLTLASGVPPFVKIAIRHIDASAVERAR